MIVTRVFLSNPGPTLRIQPDLAEEIGFNEHIAFLQLEFLVATRGTEREGHAWLRISLRELRTCGLAFWSVSKISRVLGELEQRGLIKTASDPRDRTDTTKWYAISPEGVSRLRSVKVVSEEVDPVSKCKTLKSNDLQNETGGVLNCKAPRPILQSLHLDIKQENKKEKSSCAREGADGARGGGDDDDDGEISPAQRTILAIYRETVGRAYTDRDVRTAREIEALGATIEDVERGVRQSIERAKDPINSLAYCVGAIRASVRARSRASVGAPPPAVERAPAVAIPDDLTNRVATAAFEARRRFLEEHSRQPSYAELRERVMLWAADAGVDFETVALLYPARAGEHDAEDSTRGAA
jgi:DNA-binding PadR family transcriptional regulator